MNKRHDWYEFRDALEENGIYRLYHFTARSNIQSIVSNGGLLSLRQIGRKGISSVMGGSDTSHSLDRSLGLDDYVRLSFCEDHPMAHVGQNRDRDLVVLEIDPQVIFYAGTMFTDKNAARTSQGFRRGDDIDFFRDRLHFDVFRSRYFDLDEDDRAYYQAEVLVPKIVPLRYILNICNFAYGVNPNDYPTFEEMEETESQRIARLQRMEEERRQREAEIVAERQRQEEERRRREAEIEAERKRQEEERKRQEEEKRKQRFAEAEKTVTFGEEAGYIHRKGEKANLSWDFSDVCSMFPTPFTFNLNVKASLHLPNETIIIQTPKGSHTVSPCETTTYSLTIQTPMGAIRRECTVTIASDEYVQNKFREFLCMQGIARLYHYTDIRNLNSIVESDGLLPWQELKDNECCIPGGHNKSHNRDAQLHLDGYIHLSFTPENPTMYLAMGHGYIGDPAVLEINASILWSEGSLFADRSLTSTNPQIGGSLHFLENNVRFDLFSKRYFELDEDERPFYLAEVLIPGKIPLEAIVGGSDYLQEAIERKKAFNAAVDSIKFLSSEGNAAKTGDQITLQWDLSPVGQFLKSAEISQGNKTMKNISPGEDLTGEEKFSVTHNLRFHLKIETTYGDITRDVEVKKVDEIIVKEFSIDCEPENLNVRLSWNVSGADSVSLVGYGDQKAVGELKTNAEPGAKFTLRAINQIEARDITIKAPADNSKKRHIGKCEGFAAVTFVDKKRNLAFATIGMYKTTKISNKSISGNVATGSIFKFAWDEFDFNKNVTSVEVIDKKLLSPDIDYIKTFRGIVKRNEGQSFAFVKGGGVTCFIAPDIVNRLGLVNGSACNFVATTTFNNKKGDWGWSCVSAEKVVK